MNLGKLKNLHDQVERSDLSAGFYRTALLEIIRAMARVDGDHVTKSNYRELAEHEQDEPPDGDTFNVLWDAVLDEISPLVVVKENHVSAGESFDRIYAAGFNAALVAAEMVALDLENRWRKRADKCRQRKRWFFGSYTDPEAEKEARTIEAAADGIKAIREMTRQQKPVGDIA